MANALKYLDIVDWAVKQISSGEFLPEEKFPSEAELGQRFGFSRQTVRRALEVLEQQGYITRIQGSGTYISPTAVTQRSALVSDGTLSMTVGMIFTFMDNYIFPSIIRGAEKVFAEQGFAVQLASTRNTVVGEANALRLLLSRPLDGLIVEPTRSALPCANIELYRAAMERGIPLVFVDSFYPELPLPHVALDDVRAGYVAAAHLIEKGHRRIAGIFPHSHRQGHLRYLGYVKALAERNIPLEENHIIWYSRENMNQILHSHQLLDILSTCTGVLSYNDWNALMIIEFLRESGIRVPDDISVVGIDNSDSARFVGLTSVAHPAAELGEAGANMLLSMIRGGEGRDILFPPRLEERVTVKDLRDR